LPLSEKARIEIYLPDLPTAAYGDLLEAIEREFTYTLGGCTTLPLLSTKTLHGFRVTPTKCGMPPLRL
jgi:hypothetical protein